MAHHFRQVHSAGAAAGAVFQRDLGLQSRARVRGQEGREQRGTARRRRQRGNARLLLFSTAAAGVCCSCLLGSRQFWLCPSVAHSTCLKILTNTDSDTNKSPINILFANIIYYLAKSRFVAITSSRTRNWTALLCRPYDVTVVSPRECRIVGFSLFSGLACLRYTYPSGCPFQTNWTTAWTVL